MFSPSLNQVPTGSVRGTRRRQRPLSNEGSISQPKAKRQRSALTEQTFVPPDGAREMEEVKAQKATAISRRASSREVPGPRRELPVRGRKPKSGDRGGKLDGSLVLTTNDAYTVSKLPALPDRLRTDTTGRQRGAIYSDSGYALTLTHSHAIVWPYAVNVPSPETFTFELPYSSKHGSGLPLGSLVSASASSTEPGLVVVTPNSGKITYWESIASAATLDLIRQQRNGVELSIPGIHTGETVVQILNAESAGFILAFSSGRLAYMSVRDGQGRPGISVQFLRVGNGLASGGIFGGIRNAFNSSALRGDIAAVRAGPADKAGERNIVVATAKGKLQSWNIHRGGHNLLQIEVEGRDSVIAAMKDAQPALGELPSESFEVLDFTYTPKSIVDTQLSDQGSEGIHLLLLASLSDHELTHYSLVEVVLEQDRFTVGSIRPINSYRTSVSRESTSKTRIYLPNPALVAYVVFDRAVVVLSMAKQPDSPDSQLRTESHIQPQAFEDVIDFRGDLNVEIVGSGMEEPHGPSNGIEDSKSRRYKAKHPAAILIVRGGGVVRVAATDITKLISNKAQQVTAKSKLEQAVFFGTLEKNPLSFAVRPELQFPSDEVGAAALQLSHEILKSETSYMAAMPASVDISLRKRSAALQHLATHLKATGVDLDRATKWRLLWGAEKVAAAIAIWEKYDARVREKPEGQKRGILTDIVESIHENYKSEPVAEAGELDRVRHWFINDIWNLEIAVPWAYQRVKYAFQDGQNDHPYVLSLIDEGDELVIGALETAFKFRAANLDLYGLRTEQLEQGVLKSNYEGLPEFWTSMIYLTENVRKQADLVGMLTKHYLSEVDIEMDAVALNRVRSHNPTLVDLAIRTSTERSRWARSQESPQLQKEAEDIQAVQSEFQDRQITFLATDLELSDEAISLAERHRVMPTLASIMVMEIDDSADRLQAIGPGEEYQSWSRRLTALQENVRRYFSEFGTAWATALYEYEIKTGAMAHLLNNNPEEQAYLTKFLRGRPEYSKLAWIHEVTREKDIDHAAKALLDVGLRRERNLWSKKVALSIGTMARSAGRSYSQSDGFIIPDGGQTELALARNELGLVKIQDQSYNYVLPSIEAAIDENAEVQLALEAHGNKHLRQQKRSSLLLDQSMSRLLSHEAMDALTLVDLLTLIDGGDVKSDAQESFGGVRFYLALQATSYGIVAKDEQILTQRIIWRRCILRDNWTEVNDTDMKDDQQVSERLRRTSLYRTFRACYKNGLFDKNSSVKPMSPQDILGAGTDELDSRFKNLESNIREDIMKDMQVEDGRLQPYIQKSRLDKWYQGALDLAQQDSQEEVEAQANDGKLMRSVAQQLQEIERQIAEGERKRAESMLHSKPRYKPKARSEGANKLRMSARR